MRKIVLALASLASLLSVAAAGGATGASGALDASWGRAGSAGTPLLYGRDLSLELSGLIRLPNGKVVAEADWLRDAGNPVRFVARYDANGAPDTGFGRGGVVRLPAGAGGPLLALRGGLLLAGNVRLRADGAVDRTFRPPSALLGRARVTDVVALPDGRLIETASLNRTRPKGVLFALFRLLPNGRLDTTFGTSRGLTSLAVGDPRYSLQSPFGITSPRSAIVAPDHSIYVVGEAGATAASGEFVVIHYSAEGRPDRSFGKNGVVATRILAGSGASRVVRLRDGRLVVAGYAETGPVDAPGTTARVALARYRPDGTLDPTFGAGGTLVTSLFTAGIDFPEVALAAAPAGRLVVGPHNGYTKVARLLPAGMPDPTFGTGGVINPKLSWASIVAQPDGKILVGGISTVHGKLGIVVRRYLH